MRQRLGQHFLKNHSIIGKITDAIDVQSGETIIEIGPGHGELTLPLAEICASKKAALIAIEKDPELADLLTAKNIPVQRGDALDILPAKTIDAGTYKIVGNIPYYITGYLLRTISELENKPVRCVLMIQEEVAERICAEPPKMNRLAASVHFWADSKIIARVPRTDFSPPPKVASAILKLDRKDPQPKNIEQYYSAVRILFAQPRKTIVNNLARKETSKETVLTFLKKIGLNPQLRPQNLSIEDIFAISNLFL